MNLLVILNELHKSLAKEILSLEDPMKKGELYAKLSDLQIKIIGFYNEIEFCRSGTTLAKPEEPEKS